MSENGEIYTAGQKFYTAAGSDVSDKSHLCINPCHVAFPSTLRCQVTELMLRSVDCAKVGLYPQVSLVFIPYLAGSSDCTKGGFGR